MSGKKPIFYGAMLLTAVNLALRFVSTSFQVYLSATIWAAGVGLLQLVLSVQMVSVTAAMAGIRTTAMYLSAEELGRKRPDNAARLLGGCALYSVATSGAVSVGLFIFAPFLAREVIGTAAALPALRCLAAFVPLICLGGVMTGYFTAANRIGTLAAVEVAEQAFVMAVTLFLLRRLAPGDLAGSCRAVVLGTGCGAALTLLCLLFLYSRRRSQPNGRLPITKRILGCAVPLALADDLKAGISALENLMVPKRLALYGGTADPLAAFGIVSGMVFPVLMFPAAILFSLAELLIPELARCAAVGSRARIRYLVKRNLRITLLYGLFCGGVLFLITGPLCERLYPGVEVAPQLRRFCCLAPMLYCDLIVDAMTKGLGQQTYCVRYNILTNALDVALLFVLLPRFGLEGYFVSFTVTHLLNFLLSLRRLRLCAGVRIRFFFPALALAAALAAVWGALWFHGSLWQISGFCLLFFLFSFLFGVLRPEDVRWFGNLVKTR